METSTILQLWYKQNMRDLPWRHTTDPYKIWLSEIILQQTRVIQGLAYYERFIKTYPSVELLAAASEDEILKLWQGLGYYSRARNLHKAAKEIIANCWENADGTRISFPTKSSDLLQLPGIGVYTAAAIASFSTGEPIAVVDGNVYRVLSRLFDLNTPIDTPRGQKEYAALAQELLDEKHAASHNQAIMEFGALQCTPTSPKCGTCPLSDKCLALANHSIELRPNKANKIIVHERHLYYYILMYNKKFWVHQRKPGDIWQGLWEFYCKEEKSESFRMPAILDFTIKHQLTHQTLICDFQVVQLSPELAIKIKEIMPSDYIAVSWEDWQKKAVPKLISMANERISALF